MVVKARLLTDEEAATAVPKVAVQMHANVNSIDKNKWGTIKRIWDNYRVVGEVQKTPKKKLVVAAAIRDGVKYVYIREFYLHRDTGEWVPNVRQGLTIPVLYPIFDFQANKIVDTIIPFAELADLMFEAAELLEDMFLFDDEHAIFAERKKKGQTNGNDNL